VVRRGVLVWAAAGLPALAVLAAACTSPPPPPPPPPSLQIKITYLPARLAGHVLVTGPQGHSWHLKTATTLQNLAPGSYRVTAQPVKARSGTTYVPPVTWATRVLSRGDSRTVTVAYYTQIPARTKPLATADIVKVTAGAGDTRTVVVSGKKPLAAGDIIAAGKSRKTPDGLLDRITTVTAAGAAQTLTIVPATLQQAIPQGQFSFSHPRASGPHRFSESLECGATGSATVSGFVTASVKPTLHARWSHSSISATAGATAQGSSQLQAKVSAGAKCKLSPVAVSSPVELGTYDVQVGPVPIVIVPKLQFFVQGTASAAAAVTMSAGQKFTATASLSYNHRKLSPHRSLHKPITSHQAPAVTGTADANLSVGPQLTLALYGTTGPVINVDTGLDLQEDATADPWLTLDGTVNAGVILDVPKLGINVSNDHVIHAKYPLAKDPGSVGRGSVKEIPANGLGDNPVNGTRMLVAGPDGRLWMVGLNCGSGLFCLQALDPSTDRVRSYRLTIPRSGATFLYNGPLAFDGAGQLWLSGTEVTASTSTDILMRYTPATGALIQFRVPADCQGSLSGGYGQLTSASDGHVWMYCSNQIAHEQWLVRIATDGSPTTIHITSGGLGALAAGANGSMWTVASAEDIEGTPTGIVKVTSSGQQRTFRDAAGESSEAVVGNGTGKLVDVVGCSVNGVTATCYQNVAADGTKRQFAVAPDNAAKPVFHASAMDHNGNVWQLAGSKAHGPAASGQYYFEATPGRCTTIYPLHLPSPNASKLLIPTGPPVVTIGGVVWAEEVYPHRGYLLRFAPEQQGHPPGGKKP
jgi:hypothetical protein